LHAVFLTGHIVLATHPYKAHKTYELTYKDEEKYDSACGGEGALTALGTVLGADPPKMSLSPAHCETDWSGIRS